MLEFKVIENLKPNKDLTGILKDFKYTVKLGQIKTILHTNLQVIIPTEYKITYPTTLTISGFISANIGIAPTLNTWNAGAAKVHDGTITSSPYVTLHAINAECIAEAPESKKEKYFVCKKFDISFSISEILSFLLDTNSRELKYSFNISIFSTLGGHTLLKSFTLSQIFLTLC